MPPVRGQILAAVMVGMLGGVLALAGRRPERFLLAVLVTTLALRSARVLPIAALLLLPLANAGITESLKRAAGLKLRLREGLDGFLTYSARLRVLDLRQNGLALAPVALLLCFGILRTPGIRAATGFAPISFRWRPTPTFPRMPASSPPINSADI